jgi:predicted amino acid dehydrogenase
LHRSLCGIGEPGTARLGIRRDRAGLGGRRRNLGINADLATASVKGEPGSVVVDVSKEVAGLGGRKPALGIKPSLATASVIGEPGTI